MENDLKQVSGKGNSGKKKKQNSGLIIILIILFLLLAGLAAAFAVYKHYYNEANYETDPESIELETQEAVLESIETVAEEEEAELWEEIEKEQSEAGEELGIETAEDKAKSKKKKKKSGSEDELYNILLVGVDRRDTSWNGNSDAMILCTVNYSKKKVVLTSMMRDTCANIPNVGIRKLNAAFALGGAPLLVNTVESNFLVDIDNYAWLDFTTMQQVIDVLGGVDITLNVQEASKLGIDIEFDQAVHLNGEQALRYARDRSSSGNSDFTRTQRQRNVIMAIVGKAKAGGFGDLKNAAEAVLPYITHNIDQWKLLSLMTDLVKIREFEFTQQRIPYDGLFYFQSEMLVPDYAETIRRMQEAMN